MKRLAIALFLTAASALAQVQPAPAIQVREELASILRGQPPQVRRVLQLDPTLLSNDAYMTNYPALAAFVKQHPEVQHNAAYFFGTYDEPDFPVWRGVLGDVAGFLVFLVITSVAIWVVKTIVEQRRWNRLSAIQTEVHSKLMDRFTSNDELLAYLQTPAGKKFLEAAPIPLDAGPKPLSAPIGRIFWSLQAGLILIAAGIGFDLVSLRQTGDAATGLYGVGVIALLVGIAMVLSAGIFYLLSRRFGLWAQSVS